MRCRFLFSLKPFTLTEQKGEHGKKLQRSQSVKHTTNHTVSDRLKVELITIISTNFCYSSSRGGRVRTAKTRLSLSVTDGRFTWK